MGRAKVQQVTAAEIGTRTTALSMALVAGADELDPAAVAMARRVVDKAVGRSGIAGDHTVVALAGATGSGKSSLFNALVGADVATIGARRPTTASPTAAIWGDADASELLDWLGIAARHGVNPETGAESGAPLDGLVLLDLPDFDSREVSHRREAERVLELIDVFVWVTDPQKYADAKLHGEFVSLMSNHDAVTLGVLNHSDRLPSAAVKVVADDLARLLVADGVRDARVLTTSAVTGKGIADLKQRLANAVAGHAASRQRLKSDVTSVASGLRQDVADREPVVADLDRTQLDSALARAAGVPIVLDAVERDYRREALLHTGFLLTRWTSGFTANPLRRLRLDRSAGRAPIAVDIDGADVRAVLGRSSIPAPTASTVSAVDRATRGFVRAATKDLPVRWQQAVEHAVDGGAGSLSDALDRAMLRTSLRARRPIWWFVVNVLQWVLGLVAVVGLAWYIVLWASSLFLLPRPETPSVWILPVPLVMLAGGLLVGIGVGALSRWCAQVGARRRKGVIARRLGESVATVADEQILIPIDLVLLRHRETREQLDAAAA
jgi:GTP-binding protein EngB required for normal cell division